MGKVLVFAGTVEGRRITQYLARAGIGAHICVATEYGGTLLPSAERLTISTKRLTKEEMGELFLEQEISLVIDATHPYAVQVSQNIKQVCMEYQKEYMRVLRRSITEHEEAYICVTNTEEAVHYLESTEGRVLLTTGSKELAKFTALPDYRDRLFARVLSTPEVVAECHRLGLQGSHLICMQGPFSEELNYAMLRQIDARYLVTKESGHAGGFLEKLRAASRAGVKTIVVGRPAREEGLSVEECLRLLRERYGIAARKKIVLLGIGMGSPQVMTVEGRRACEEADVIIGAKRMLASLASYNKPVLTSYRPEEIRAFIDNQEDYHNIVVALSGDVGFYSGAANLIKELKEYEVKLLPGISSVVYLCSRIKQTWQDVRFISNHGRYENLIGAVRTNHKVFTLLGGQGSVSKLCQSLIEYGLEEVLIYTGEQLSYEQEKITMGGPRQLMDQSFSEPCVALIINAGAEHTVITHGIADDRFVRGRVPMTKEEIRCISVSKLRLTRTSVLYDIGAGTGSVAIETALQISEGMVYAIEKNAEAVALIEENKRKFGADNLMVIQGMAPEAMEQLPAPTHAFIGGTAGNLRGIMRQLFNKNPNIRFVINAITLETLSEMLQLLKEFKAAEAETLQVSVSKAREVGGYHMMQGQNPVYIISGTGSSAGDAKA